MNLRKLTWPALALVLLLAGTLWWWHSRSPAPALPALQVPASLPAQFNTLLASAHRAATTSPSDSAAVRQLAHLYHANRLAAEARACYAWLAAHDAGLTAEDHRLLADLALEAGDLPAGIAALRATLEADPTYTPARVLLADALFKSGDEKAAAAEYEALLARTPDQPQALLGLARVALQQGDDATAIVRLERLLAVHRDATSGAALLAQIMKRRGETERAAALTEWSRQRRDPIVADPWLDALWADCYDVQRVALRIEELSYSEQFDAAAPLLARLEELDPQSWLPHLFKGWTANRARRPEEAVAEFRLALQKRGDPERILPLLAPTLAGLGRAAEAEAEVNRALATHPDSIALLVLQADFVVQRGGDARPLLLALLQREPYLYKPNMDLAKILWTSGDRAGAVVCLTRVTKAFPVDVASRGLLGQFHLENDDPGAAIPPLEQALPQAEAKSAAREKLAAMLGSAYLQQGARARTAGNIAEAAGWFEKAAGLVPQGFEALAALAGEAVQAKEFSAAADVLARLAKLQPHNPTIALSLGDVLYQGGNPATARAHWEQALKLAAPRDQALREALRRRIDGPITPELFN